MPEIPDDESWAVTEWADADLGDARRTQRLVELATVLAQRPSASWPEACSSRAQLKAAYRFLDNDANDPHAILASHVEATTARLAAVPRVLAVPETTELDWTAHPATTGLGPLAHPDHHGLPVPTTLALTPERVPVGLLAQHVWAREPDPVGTRATRKRRPITEQESQQWLTRVEAVMAAQAQCPHTHVVWVGDREAEV
jgi:transposase-like protein